MGFHIVTIDSPNCHLTCKDGQLTCKSGTTTRCLPLEDVAAIVVVAFSTSVHSSLLVEAAKNGMALIFCEAYKPISLVLPANRSTDTLLTRAQVEAPFNSVTRMWSATINAKCSNQIAIAKRLGAHGKELRSLHSQNANPSSHKEATCAKHYWRIFSQASGDTTFTRDQQKDGLNSFLNYGYAVLLSVVLQKLFAVGIDPTFGIAHATRERSTPLAYDLMEPFRPLVDWRIFEWLQVNGKLSDDETVSKKLRQWITGFLLEETAYCDATIQVHSCIEAVVRSFRRALREKKPTLYKPWTLKNSKWAG